MSSLHWSLTKKRTAMLGRLAKCPGLPLTNSERLEYAVEVFLQNVTKWSNQDHMDGHLPDEDPRAKIFSTAVLESRLPGREFIDPMDEMEVERLTKNAQALLSWLDRMRQEKHEQELKVRIEARAKARGIQV